MWHGNIIDITARVTYSKSGTPNQLRPATVFDEYDDFDETALRPTDVQAVDVASVSYRFDTYFATFDDGTNRASCTSSSLLLTQTLS